MPTTIAVPKKKAAPAAQEDFLPLEGTDYIEFYVGNAKQAAHFYQSALGFQPVAYSGPETGVRERASYVVRQNRITFVLTTPIRAKHPIADHIIKHGDGVKAIALKVKDATSAWTETTKRGGKSYMEPKPLKDEQGDEQWERLREVPDQRAGRRQKEIAGGGISRVLRWRRRPAHRHGHEQHYRNGDCVGEARA